MEYPKNTKKRIFSNSGFIFFCIILVNCLFITQRAAAKFYETEGTIAVFFGSENDRKLSEDLITHIEKTAVFYNITEVLSDSSFVFNNDSFVSIWWINELPLPIDLGFLASLANWKETNRGIFLLNRYFEHTPIEILNQFGIRSYAPLVVPINGSFSEQKLILNPKFFTELNETELTTLFSGSAAWVDLSDQCQVLAEISPPFLIPELNNLTSGIWRADSREIVASFSINYEIEPIGYGASLQSIAIVDLLAQVAEITIGTLSGNNNAFLQMIGLGDIVTVGIISITSIFLLVSAIKFGLLTKLKDFIVGILMSGFFLIAHIAYSPQKRRISEDELLENELREQIMEYLQHKGEEGAHLREIQREVGCGISSLLWHLQALDDFNLVTHAKLGKYHIFYLTGEKSTTITELALALKSDVAKELCRLLLREPKPLSLSKISQEIDVHHSSVQHHIKKLGELGIIITVKDRKRYEYMVGPKHLNWLRNYLEAA
ncbi:MAG: HTH domain-containing protein [Candidatus Heimdallarchaeota archaeon]|nr:HTH domain-containing protein [Candidatus Heimdallarchaeota archaeon]